MTVSPSATPQLWIGGFTRRRDVVAAAHAGVHGVGVAFDDEARSVPTGRITGLFEGLDLVRVGQFEDRLPERVATAHRAARLDVAWLAGHETPEWCQALVEDGVCTFKHLAIARLEDLSSLVGRYAWAVDGVVVAPSRAILSADGDLAALVELAHEHVSAPVVLCYDGDDHGVLRRMAHSRADAVLLPRAAELSPGVKDDRRLRRIAHAFASDVTEAAGARTTG